MIKPKIVIWLIGVILLIFSLFMLFPLLWALFGGEPEAAAFAYAIGSTAIVGGLFALLKPGNKKFGRREGFLVVTLSWLTLGIAGALPYLYSGTLMNFAEAFFESTSGLTTTGASVITEIEALPRSILLWRSLTQWIGGMGIIVLTVAVLPLLGVSGVELFVAEAPGPKSEKIHPTIKETAKRLWLIYFGLTVLLCLILHLISGMTFFDAMNHAMTTMSTGGFSTKNTSIAHYDQPIVQYPIILFMFLAGMNYTIIYFGLTGKLKKVWGSDEFKAYLLISLATVLAVSASVYYSTDSSLEKSFRDAAFQVVSVVTTTGYVSADYTAWNNPTTILFFFLLFAGACAGSTSGGIKFIRHLVFAKNATLEFKRLLHPKAMIRMKIDKKLVSPRIMTHILVFLLIYLSLFMGGSMIMSIILTGSEQTLLTSFGAVATCLGNVGPGIGTVGPVDNFAHIPDLGKGFLSLLMIVGRLELFTVLILFTPFFWRSN